ncbi:hypothetical protein M569_10983 [Genlisea aurea]|uniref:Cellulose synthase n=1 Tax=Genlisea aurea TaxID=192259 RepID=S8CGS4_9LAMI|nr:hypothetical protein M569_10983 [Genlisea aurea]
MGLKYGCLVEDVITGIAIHCRGWKSIYMKPKREGFMGMAGTTLDQNLVQHKRWSEGNLQIMLSKYNPAWYGFGRLHIGFVAGYSIYGLWGFNCFATLCYAIIPSLYLLKGVPLFPPVSSFWFYPFLFVAVADSACSFAELVSIGGTSLGWLNLQRMWLYKRVSSYLFATVDALLRLIGFPGSGFIVSAKVSDDEALERYGREMIEFGVDSPMVTIISWIAALNFVSFAVAVARATVFGSLGREAAEVMALQIALSGAVVAVNLPLYAAALFRKDGGRLPSSVTVKSVFAAVTFAVGFGLEFKV